MAKKWDLLENLVNLLNFSCLFPYTRMMIESIIGYFLIRFDLIYISKSITFVSLYEWSNIITGVSYRWYASVAGLPNLYSVIDG